MGTTWVDIASTDRDVDSPHKQQNFDDLHTRDESLRAAPFFLGFAEVTTTSTTPVVMFSKSIYIPRWAAGLTVAAQYEIVGAVPVGTFTWSIGGSAMTDGDTINIATVLYTDTKRFTIDALPAALLGTRATLELKGDILAAGQGTAKSKQIDGPACRFE